MLQKNSPHSGTPEETAILLTFMSSSLNGGPAPQAVAIFRLPNEEKTNAVLAGNPCLCRYDRGTTLVVGLDARHRHAWEQAFKAAAISFDVKTIEWVKVA
jgi:hypothetical protein